MQIHIKNEIDLDGHTERIEQVYPVKVTEKNSNIYLIYINEEDEKVMIKCNETEMVMTRFSTPKSIMRFHKENPALAAISTPLGIQHLMTETAAYKADFNKQLIKIDYQLRQAEGRSVFASYKLEVSWS